MNTQAPQIRFRDRNGREVARARLTIDLYKKYNELVRKVDAQIGGYADSAVIVSITALFQAFIKECCQQGCLLESLTVKIEPDSAWGPSRLNISFEKAR